MSALMTPPRPVMKPTGLVPKKSRVRGGGLYRITVSKYHRMLETGVLGEGDPVELLEGKLVRKMSVNPPHAWSVQQLNELLFQFRPAGWLHRIQNPIVLRSMTSEPEPDASLFPRASLGSDRSHPSVPHIGLVVEVAEATLRRDRGMKQRVYARESIPEYWIVNLVDDIVEVYTQPSGPAEKPAYRQRNASGTTIPAAPRCR
jgi:Uma2 family endonuclease